MLKLMTLLLALVLVASACADGPPAVLDGLPGQANEDTSTGAAPSAGSEPIDGLFTELRENGFNGIVLIDVDGDLDIGAFGTADGPDGPDIDESTVFDIGSVTKQFTGAAIVRLEMDGHLSVDDRLGDHVPEVTGPLADVTLHELLTHTAGLPDALGDDYEGIDRGDYIALASAAAGPPGAHAYSNVGYSLLGMVIESVTGGSYEAYLHTALFEPAGMASTGYVLPDWDEHVVAVGYDGDQRLEAPHELPWADDGPWWHLRANGGILSTADDMRRWHRALRGDDVLSDEAKDKLFARHVSEGDGAESFYGYGWVSFPTPEGGWFHGHNGGNGIFFADFLRLPDQDAMIFVATNAVGANEDIAFQAAELLTGEELIGPSCGPTEDPTNFPSATEFPDTPAGATAEATITILLGGDASARRAFVEAHVPASLAPGLSLDEQVDGLASIQEEFDGLDYQGLHIEDEHRYHAVLTGDDVRSTVTIVVDEADPQYLACLHIDVGQP